MAASAVGLATALAAGRPSNYYYSHPPHYMSMMRSPDWWDSGELTGDWGGLRNTFYDDGVNIFANYTNNIVPDLFPPATTTTPALAWSTANSAATSPARWRMPGRGIPSTNWSSNGTIRFN